MQVRYDSIVSKQEHWKSANLPESMVKDMVALSNRLMHKLIDNGHDLEGVRLFYPEDCDNYEAFSAVAYALDACVTTKKAYGIESAGAIMHGFGENLAEIEVE